MGLGFPKKSTKWLMVDVITISYIFNIAGIHTRIMDPISPLLFVVVKEYLPQSVHKLSKIPNNNFHYKCEKLHIININFANDLL